MQSKRGTNSNSSSGQLAELSTARAASGLTYDVIAAKPAAPCGTTTALGLPPGWSGLLPAGLVGRPAAELLRQNKPQLARLTGLDMTYE